MTGRGRGRARGRPEGQQSAVPAVGAAAVRETLPSEGPDRSRPRPLCVPVAAPGDGQQRGPASASPGQSERKPGVGLQLSAGMQALSLAERGRCRDFHDLGVNTRQTMEHVQESKSEEKMTGRGRGRARGRPEGQQSAVPAVGAAAVRETLPSEGPDRSRPRPLCVPVAASGDGQQRGPASASQGQSERKPGGLQLSAGMQALSLAERGRCRDFHDLGVNTRQAMEHVQESKSGSSGSLIKLTANYFRLTSRPQWSLYQYHVAYSPEMEGHRLRSALLLHHEDIIGITHAFDGTILFLPRRLANKVTQVCSRTRNGEDVKITITLTNELPPTSPTCLQFYNIIFRRLLKMLDMQQIGRNYYNPSHSVDIPNHRLTVWEGFITSILSYEEGVMLCTDVSHKVLRSETVLESMYSLYYQVDKERYRDACAKEVVGLVVLTKYNNRTYRIDSIDWDANPRCTFRRPDGSEISFVDYYKRQYNQEITDLNQPVLLSEPKRKKGTTERVPVILIPELCFLTGLTDSIRSDFRVMKDLSGHTQLPPEKRQRQIGRLMDSIQRDDGVQQELRDWGLSFDSHFISFTGRVARAEKIFQSRSVVEYDPQFANWTRESRGVPVTSAKPLDNWLLLYPRRSSDSGRILLQSLAKVMPSLGIRMEPPTMVEVDDRTEAYIRALQHTVTQDTNMVVCVLSGSRKDRYDAIKKYLCTDCPVPSQCVLSRTLSRPQSALTIATKIALQMNSKMGGELWSVEMPLKQVMIVGIDCYHDTSFGKQSVAGFVASLNPTVSRWFSHCALQDRGQEIVDGLKSCLLSALREWVKWNKCLPSRIIVYRDGVGDGQLATLISYEVPQFLNCLKTLGTDYNPGFTVIVVKKRGSTRLFAQAAGTVKNPPPGTIVDGGITRPEWYDFFIVSQAVIHGCIAPTHYNVVYDTSELKPDHLQRLTYKLCHMYYNWSGIIRVPAPCQYAHKLAFLVGQSIHREPNLSLADKLYYL